uniref:Acid phosphatase n=1 Tax=Graphocephala atropunctata TaxID=36148 RepID=A0A1B6KJX7_9HEMI
MLKETKKSGLYWLYIGATTLVLVVLVVVYHVAENGKTPVVSSPTLDRPGSRAAPTLQFVAVFSRHGNRAPIFSYPTSEFQKDDTKVWPHGAGQLTTIGRVQMYKLGEKFRSLYNGFLSELYRPGDVVTYSTHFDRCFESAQLILAGLFPPQGFQVWNSQLLWQPIPVLYTERDHVMIVLSKETRYCSKFHKEKKKSLARYERDFGYNLTRMLEYALPFTSHDAGNTKLNTSIVSMWADTYTLWESLVNPEMEGFQLPAWASKIYPQPITSLIMETFRAGIDGSDTMLRLMAGQLFQEIMGLMEARLEDKASAAKRLYIYNGHDFTMVGLQRILGLKEFCHWVVEPSSAVIVELHTDTVTGRSYVQLLYIDGVSKDLEPVELDIPGCDSPCDFHQLINITNKYYNITDWEKECENY